MSFTLSDDTTLKEIHNRFRLAELLGWRVEELHEWTADQITEELHRLVKTHPYEHET